MAGFDVKGCCPLDCQDACAWTAHVEDGRVTKVTGVRDHPFTRGVLCAKVNDYPEKTYAESRILHPMRRTGAKGGGAFARISWDEALDEIAARFRSIKETHGAEAVLPMHDQGASGVLQRRALMRLFHAFGASKVHGSLCGASGNALVEAGHPIGFDPEEIAESELILLWGSNLLSTAHHHWRFCELARKEKGAKIIAIDPRRTRTARKCDEHIPIRPGTDLILAAAMANVMVAEGLADLDYARSAATDVDAYLAEIAPWTPEKAAPVTGISAENILRLARLYGNARPGTIRSSIGPEQTIDGDLFVLSISALAILSGHWRRKGGGLMIEAYPTVDNQPVERPDLAPPGVRSLDRAQLGRLLTDPDLDPPVEAYMVWAHNPMVSQPDADRVRRGLLRDDLFTVVIEHVMTDTARLADIILPSTTQLEHFDLQGSWGHHYVSVNHPAVPPLGEARPHTWIMRELARRLGLEHPALYEDDESIVRAALPHELDFERLMREGWTKASPPRSDPAANGPVLRIAAGLPAPDADRLPGDAPKDRLRLLTPKPHYFLNSTFGDTARHLQQQGAPVIEMNPADAGRLSLSDGQVVTAENDLGAVTAALRVTDAIIAGTVVMEGKWWWRDGDDGAAVTNRICAGEWTATGQPTYNDTFVEIAPASQ